jgi:general L-amino acid transport system substrate-binding protein
MAGGNNPVVARLLGETGTIGTDLALPSDWVVKVIGAVGNYGEIFERNLGAATPFGFERGQNALWTQGGLMYAPPYR